MFTASPQTGPVSETELYHITFPVNMAPNCLKLNLTLKNNVAS